MPWSLFMIVLVALWSTPVWADDMQDYTVGPQDVLTVQVYNESDLSGNFSITASGEILALSPRA